MAFASRIFLAAMLIGAASFLTAAVFYFRARPHYIGPKVLLTWLRRPLARYQPSNYAPDGVVSIRRAGRFYFIFVACVLVCVLTGWLGFGAAVTSN